MMRKHFIFSGHVQGVGFRYIFSMYAISFGLTGFVRNLNNGDVEAQVQGEEVKMSALVEKMKSQRHIWIEHIEENEIPEVKEEKKFKIR